MLIGYARVSKADGFQSLDLQRDALGPAGVDAGNVYHDLASGVRDDRPGLDSCLRTLRKDDVLVVWKLDRLGRNLAHLVNTVHDLAARGVGLRGARRPRRAGRHHDRGRPPRHLRGAGRVRQVGVRAVPRARHQAGDALPVRRPAGPVAGRLARDGGDPTQSQFGADPQRREDRLSADPAADRVLAGVVSEDVGRAGETPLFDS